MTKIVSMILSVGQNGLIGRKDKLVWKSKEDLNYFKSKTYMQPCIFGATTFYGLPKYPLVNRLNIVLDNSQKEEITADNRGWVTCNSFECALLFCENYDEVFVCGGRSIYEYALNYNFANRIYLTRVYSKELEELSNSKNEDLVYFDIDKYVHNCQVWNLSTTQLVESNPNNPLFIKFELYEKIEKDKF